MKNLHRMMLTATLLLFASTHAFTQQHDNKTTRLLWDQYIATDPHPAELGQSFYHLPEPAKKWAAEEILKRASAGSDVGFETLSAIIEYADPAISEKAWNIALQGDKDTCFFTMQRVVGNGVEPQATRAVSYLQSSVTDPARLLRILEYVECYKNAAFRAYAKNIVQTIAPAASPDELARMTSALCYSYWPMGEPLLREVMKNIPGLSYYSIMSLAHTVKAASTVPLDESGRPHEGFLPDRDTLLAQLLYELYARGSVIDAIDEISWIMKDSGVIIPEIQALYDEQPDKKTHNAYEALEEYLKGSKENR